MKRGQNKQGFTIVELLIVIVVIGILAAISLVVYNGMIARAHDGAIVSDLAKNAKKIEIYAVDQGSYPQGAVASAPAGIGFTMSKNSYDTTLSNAYYCEGLIGGQQVFRISARSKSGQTYVVQSGVNPYKYAGTPNMPCSAGNFDGGARTFSYGYDQPTQQWHSWVQ